MFSVCQIYKVWKQFTTSFVLKRNTLRCFQYVKFIKFESNSQHAKTIRIGYFMLFSVCQIYKVWKQFTTSCNDIVVWRVLFSVCQIYKVWKQFTTYDWSQDISTELFSVCQIYKVWKQFTTAFFVSPNKTLLFSVCQIYKVWKQFTTDVSM